MKKYCWLFLHFFIFKVVLLGVAHGAFSESFAPISIDLDRAVEIALSDDKSVKAAESDVAKAYEGKRQAHRARGLTLKLEHNAARVKSQREENTLSVFGNTVSAMYPLYTGGLFESTIAASEQELNSKIYSLERTRQEVRLAVANAFFAMLRTEDMAKLALDAVTRLEAHVRNVDVQYRNGKVSKADLLRSEVELISARQKMSQTVNEHKVAVKNLNNLMGMPLDTQLSYDGKMIYFLFPHTLEQCLEYALSHHPDLAIAKALKEKAKAGISMEESAQKPKVSLAVTQALDSFSNQDWPGLEQDNIRFGLHAEYTFSDAGVTASKIRGAKEDLKKADYHYEATQETIVLNVTKYFMTMEEAKTRIDISSVALEKAQEAYKISLARYREGIGTNIDVLDAQTALNQAASNHTQALCDYNIAVAQVENAMGAMTLYLPPSSPASFSEADTADITSMKRRRR
ncbi:MAG: TolC family protein [Synergistaceae bacterium]|nr:TolC family protein [Synergistaceae bacterium]